MSTSLIPVTTYHGLMADGRRVSWQSFRPANAAPGSKPTVYFTTLPADADAGGTSLYNLTTVGAQAVGYAVELTLLAGTAQLKLAGQPAQPLAVGKPVTVPARGTNAAAELTFTGDTCSLQVVPQRVSPVSRSLESSLEGGVTTMGGTTDGDGGGGPPPPLPGNEGND